MQAWKNAGFGAEVVGIMFLVELKYSTMITL